MNKNYESADDLTDVLKIPVEPAFDWTRVVDLCVRIKQATGSEKDALVREAMAATNGAGSGVRLVERAAGQPLRA